MFEGVGWLYGNAWLYQASPRKHHPPFGTVPNLTFMYRHLLTHVIDWGAGWLYGSAWQYQASSSKHHLPFGILSNLTFLYGHFLTHVVDWEGVGWLQSFRKIYSCLSIPQEQYCRPSKNTVSANIKHIRYFHQSSNFWSIHYYSKSLYVHVWYMVDTAFSYWTALIVC